MSGDSESSSGSEKKEVTTMREAISELFAIANSGKFTAYTEGVPMTLPTGESIVIKTQRTYQSKRPIGFRFSKYAFVTEVAAGEHRSTGFGEAPTQLLALQKSIAEGVERALFKALQGTPYATRNTNGWAAHLSHEKAFNAALEELLERDAVLVHWLCQKPMKELSPSSWPNWLDHWTKAELILSPRFNQLRILISDQGYLPTVTTIILDVEGYAILSHATASTLDEAVSKALAETCRIGQIGAEGNYAMSSALLAKNSTDSTFHPEDHPMVYALHNRLPKWIFGPETTWNIERGSWKALRNKLNSSALNPKFHQIAKGPLAVGYCTSDQVQGLYFGRTLTAQSQGCINFHRLKELPHEGEINLMPHWVP